MLASNQIVVENFDLEIAGAFEVDHTFSERNMAFHDMQLLLKMEKMYYWQ